MTTTQKELIEKMAREIDPVAWSDVEPIDFDARKRSLWEATAAFAAIESAGLAIVPRDATAEMLAHALPTADDEHSDADKKLGAAACLLLSGGRDIPNEGQAVPVAAGLAEDYRAMVEFGRVK